MSRICMLAYTYYLYDSRVRREAEALIERGDQVDLICLKDNNNNQDKIYNGVRVLPISISKYRGESIFEYLRKYVMFFIQAFFMLTFLHLKKRYKIIQVHSMPDFLVFATLIPRLIGAKIILDLHDIMPELYMSKFNLDNNHIIIRLIIWVERLSIRFAQRAIAVHIPQQDIIVKHGNPSKKFNIILNLPDPKIFDRAKNIQRIDDGKFRLIYHGTIAKRNGLDIAIRAINQAKISVPNLELLILGDGDDKERLIYLLNNLKLDKFVKFSEGTVSLENVPFYLKQSDIGVIPIINDCFTKYTLPVKLLEYVTLGIPVISARIESFKYYFDEEMVTYFQPEDYEELAYHIVDLYKHPHKREKLVFNARKFTEKFNWENQKTKYYNIIDSL